MPPTTDDERVDLALRGLRLLSELAMQEGRPLSAEAIDELITALESGGDHPLLDWWLWRRQAEAGSDE
jgi:hypothetical protein